MTTRPEKPTCAGVLKNQKQCRSPATSTGFCHRHKQQYEEKIEKEENQKYYKMLIYIAHTELRDNKEKAEGVIADWEKKHGKMTDYGVEDNNIKKFLFVGLKNLEALYPDLVQPHPFVYRPKTTDL